MTHNKYIKETDRKGYEKFIGLGEKYIFYPVNNIYFM